MHQLKFTAFARDDLLAITRFIVLDNPKRAQLCGRTTQTISVAYRAR